MRAEQLLTQPTVMPVTLAQAKWHLNIDHDDDDPLIADQIRSATAFVESHTQTKLVRQKWRVFMDYALDERDLTPPPVQEIEQIQYIDGDGVTQTLSSTVYGLDRNRQKLLLAYDQVWPTPRYQLNAAWMDVWTGYYDPANSPINITGEIPLDLKAAVFMLVDLLYEQRSVIVPPNMGSNPAFMGMISPHRAMNL